MKYAKITTYEKLTSDYYHFNDLRVNFLQPSD